MAAQGMNQRPRHDHDLPTGLFLVLMAMAPGMLMAQDDGPANGQHVEVLNADRWDMTRTWPPVHNACWAMCASSMKTS